MSNVLIISDDLTGACNSASYFIKGTSEINVFIDYTFITEEIINSFRTEKKDQTYKIIKNLTGFIPSFNERIIIKN